MQAATELLGKGISTLLDAALQPPAPPPNLSPERARQLQQEAESARQAEQARHERLLGSLKLSGPAPVPSVAAPSDNPLGLKLGKPAEDPLVEGGLRPAGTAFFGLGGGSGTNPPPTAPPAPTGTDTSSVRQLTTAAGGRAPAVFDGKGTIGKGDVKPLDFDRLRESIRRNQERLKRAEELLLQREDALARIKDFERQIQALRELLSKSGTSPDGVNGQIKVLEDRKQQVESAVESAEKELKQFRVDVEEQ